MFALSSLALLLSAASSLAIPSHEIRNIHHNDIAKRANVTLSKRFTANRVTWYPTNTGADACTGRNHGDNDNIVALNIPQWGNLNSRSQHCGKKIKITANGKSAIGVIQDCCATCYHSGEIDLTKSLFQKFASLDQGVFDATWEFVDDDAGDDDDDKPAPPKTTKKPATPTKSPTPPKSTPKPSPTPDNDDEEAPVKKPTSTKKAESKPTPTPEPEHPEDNDDDDEECEEYEDDNDDTAEDNQHADNTPEEKPVKEDKPVKEEKPVKKPTPSPNPPVKPPVKVIETPKAVVPPPPVSSSSSSVVANLAPTVPIAAPAADPSPSPSQDPNDVSGGISQSSNSNNALVLSGSKALMSAVVIALAGIQLL